MNIRDLRYIIAVADTLNFRRAAARCHVSQSTLSCQILKIEEYLGVPIYIRDRCSVHVAPHGRELIRLARLSVDAFDAMCAFSSAMRRGCDEKTEREVVIEDIDHPVGPLLRRHILGGDQPFFDRIVSD